MGLQTKGYKLIRYIGCGVFKKVCLVMGGNKEFAAKVSYSHLETHQEELDFQKEFKSLAVQAIETFTIDNEEGKPTAIVEIQEIVDVYEDAREKANNFDKRRMKNQFKSLQRDIKEAGWHVGDLIDGARNAGYDHNGRLKLIDLGNVVTLEVWQQLFGR